MWNSKILMLSLVKHLRSSEHWLGTLAPFNVNVTRNPVKICCYLNLPELNQWSHPTFVLNLIFKCCSSQPAKRGLFEFERKKLFKNYIQTNSSKFEQYFSIKFVDLLNVPSFYRLRMWCVNLSSPYFMWYLKNKSFVKLKIFLKKKKKKKKSLCLFF